MPLKLNDPIDLARIFGSRQLDASHLMEVYREHKQHLTECDVASVTYLVWHESVSHSGVMFAEHLHDTNFDRACKLDDSWRLRVDANTKAHAEASAEWDRAEREERDADRIKWAGGVGSLAVLCGAAFVARRRMALKKGS